MLYCAYGSNMNTEQMKNRCHNAKLIGTGRITDHTLMFRGDPECAYATIQREGIIENDRKMGVPAVIWEISSEDESSLDRYESFPRLYRKETVDVMMNSGEKLQAMAYIMNKGFPVGLPTGNYFSIILDGYIDNDIDTEYLFERLRYVSLLIKKA